VHARAESVRDERVPVAVQQRLEKRTLEASSRRPNADVILAYNTSQELASTQLLADAKLLDDGFVSLGVVFLEVVEQATPLADQHEKTPARAVILLVRLEVLRQLANTLAE
jgi:hypothetical protein